MACCPQCGKEFEVLPEVCPTCRADLSLLTAYVNDLAVGLRRADELTRRGELAEAVWAYLSVLEVDPDNPIARRQVGQVATAVRQFDRVAPSRRWLNQIRGDLPGREPLRRVLRWLLAGALGIILLFAAFGLGVVVGSRPSNDVSGPQETIRQKESLTGKD